MIRTSMTPFANDTESQNIGSLTFENGTDQVAISGDLDITKDKEGLRRAKELKALATKIVKALEAEPDLPEKIALPIEEPVKVKNPFS